jgi:hypothetical protein
MRMKLPLGFGEIDWSDWLRGLFAAFISGGASAVTSGFVVSVNDPKDYAPGSSNFFWLVFSVFCASGLLGAMAFLRTKPIPDMKTVKSTIQVTEQGDAPPKTVSTVTEIHTEPIK